MPFILRSLSLEKLPPLVFSPIIFLSFGFILTPILCLPPPNNSTIIASWSKPISEFIGMPSASKTNIFILVFVFSIIKGALSLFSFEKSTLLNSAYCPPKLLKVIGKDTFLPSNVIFLEISSDLGLTSSKFFSTFHCTLPSGVLLAYLPVADCLPFLSSILAGVL